VCHVREKCCTVKKEMKFVTLPLYYAGNLTGFPSTSVRFPRNVGVSVVFEDIVIVFRVPSAIVLVVVPIVARRLRSVLEDWAVVSAMTRSWLMAVLAGVGGAIKIPVSCPGTFEAESATSKFSQREARGFSFLLGNRSGIRSRGGRGRVGSGRCSRNGTVGGQESDGLWVGVGRFLVLRDDGACIFSDGFHCLLESTGFLDREYVDEDGVRG